MAPPERQCDDTGNALHTTYTLSLKPGAIYALVCPVYTIDLVIARRLAAVLFVSFLLLVSAACSGSADAVTRPEDTEAGTAAVIRPGELESYYFEASVKASSQATSSAYLVIKGWWAAPDRTRWELGSSNPADAEYVRQMLIVGDTLWFYEPGTNTYTEGKDDKVQAQLDGTPYPLLSQYQLGLVPSVVMANASKTGTDTYLGRAVDVYFAVSGQIETTMLVDREYGFTLVQSIKSNDPSVPSYEAKVEKVQFNPRLSSDVFVFTPPPGARNASATPTAAGIKPTHGVLNIPQGMLSPTYLPAGYTLDSSSQTAAGGVTAYIERRLKEPGGGTIVLTETYRPGGLPEHLQLGTPLTVRGGEGFATRGGGQTTLIFYDADLIVVMQSTAVDVNELRSIAESMIVAP